RATFYDYPVGNMFWARTAALRPLLDGRITYDLFPPEQGQLDGTLAHAIERSVGLVARANGYRYDECSALSQSVRIGMGNRNVWNYPFRASSAEFR
ncbi:rhamnan synthesis F family protein, partial [Acinetobacter baumannii]